MKTNNTISKENSGTDQQTTDSRQTTLDDFVLRCDGGELVDDETSEDAELLSLTPSVKKFVRADRGMACEFCGSDEKEADLQIHHRTPRRDGGSNHPENLVLLCKHCHRRHHGNGESGLTNQDNTPPTENEHSKETQPADNETTGYLPEENTASTEPLPPRSEPNGADQSILKLIEQEGALRTGDLADETDYTEQHIRRECWKLAGEQLIAHREDNYWDLPERIDTERLQIGLPEKPKSAARAGRDEVIRQMSVHGLSDTEIAEIVGLSRRTVAIAVDRARALQISLNNSDSDEIEMATIATRLSALIELIDHSQIN